MNAIYLPLAGAALVAAALVALAPSPAEATERGYDYCQAGQSSSLFLVDRTTPYDEIDRRVVIDSISTAVSRLGPGERVTIATIGSHYSASERLIDECRPGCPEAAGPIGALLSRCRPMMATQDYDAFRARIATRVRALIATAAEAPASDITGTIAQWTRHPSGGRTYARIYIFSDMLENSQALPWRTFRQVGAEDSLSIARRYALTPNAANAEVHIIGFGRLHDPGRPPLPAELDYRLRTFWVNYFTTGRARAVTFEAALSR